MGLKIQINHTFHIITPQSLLYFVKFITFAYARGTGTCHTEGNNFYKKLDLLNINTVILLKFSEKGVICQGTYPTEFFLNMYFTIIRWVLRFSHRVRNLRNADNEIYTALRK